MVFSTAIFMFVFLPICLGGYYLIPKGMRKTKNMFLLIMSILFYGYGEPQFVYVMIASIFINWLFGLAVDKYRGMPAAKRFIALMVLWNVGIFFIYKYLNFTIATIDRFFGTDIPQTTLYLPIGISFFTFQAMSYVVDVYRGTAPVQKNPFNTALYISLFPALIAGPIIRYNSIADQLTGRDVRFNADDFAYGVKRFVIGLGKKLILANMAASVADRAFASVSGISGEEPAVMLGWIGIVCYTFQIYFDFSGYSDMAIGLGRMFGFRFLENFNYPYISGTVTEFWRRWHISLSTWFRDYVYFPLGGSHVDKKSRLVFNLFVTWMLTGIWHGAGWTFIVWGLFYFVLLTFEKLCGIPALVARSPMTALLYRIFTILCFMLGWVVFRAPTIGDAYNYVRLMFGLSVDGEHYPLFTEATKFYIEDNAAVLVICVIACMPVVKLVQSRLADNGVRLRAATTASNVFLGIVFLVCVSYMVNGSYNPFIYFNF
ncbi:MAG: MBOAT family protein [Clostridiales bacterium]|nr:MBOAT family protein [Clostridiales bacterium]